MAQKFTFMQIISWVFEYCQICLRFFNTPSEIHTSYLPRAKSKVAKHDAQCDFEQNQAYSIRGVEQNQQICERERRREQQQNVNGNEGGNNTLDFLDISSAGSSFWCQHNRRE